MNPPERKLNSQARSTRMVKYTARLKSKRDRMSAQRQCRRQLIRKYHEHMDEDQTTASRRGVQFKACYGLEPRRKGDDLFNEILSSLITGGPSSRPLEETKGRDDNGADKRQVKEKHHEELDQDQTRPPRVPDMWSGFCESYFGAGMRERNANRPALAQYLDLAIPERLRIAEMIDNTRDEIHRTGKIVWSSESSDSAMNPPRPANKSIEQVELKSPREQKPMVKRPCWDTSSKSNFMETIGFDYRDVNTQHTSRKRKLRSPHSKTHLRSPSTTDSEYDGDTDSVTGEDYAFQPPSKRVKYSSESSASHYNEWTVIEGRIPSLSACCDEQKRKVHFSDGTEISHQRRKLKESSGMSGVMMAMSQTPFRLPALEKTKSDERPRSPPMDRHGSNSSSYSRWNSSRRQRSSNVFATPSLVAHHFCKICATGPCGSHREPKVYRTMGIRTGANEDGINNFPQGRCPPATTTQDRSRTDAVDDEGYKHRLPIKPLLSAIQVGQGRRGRGSLGEQWLGRKAFVLGKL